MDEQSSVKGLCKTNRLNQNLLLTVEDELTEVLGKVAKGL